jgi:hypothetical protein|tara:strand:- start:36 stop:170 length:135 start_codon:yes stop_codon:yes gene_type:complete
MKKHPYYDSDKKNKTQEVAYKTIGICVVGVLILLIVTSILKVIG